jgi:hypothetical protein
LELSHNFDDLWVRGDVQLLAKQGLVHSGVLNRTGRVTGSG